MDTNNYISYVNYKTNAFLDTVIFSGVDDVEHDILPQINLVDDAQKIPLQELEKTLRTHKENLHMGYGKFLKNVEKNFYKLDDPRIATANVRAAVAGKLVETANKCKTQKEANFGIVHLFFHKVWQGCIGHGFQTKADYGLQLAAELTNMEKSIWKKELKDFIEGDKPAISFDKFIEKINKLDDTQFKEFMGVYVNTSQPSGGTKLEIYNRLTPERKLILKTSLENSFVGRDLYMKLYEISKGADPEGIKEFISDKMIADLANNPEEFRKLLILRPFHRNNEFDKFFEPVINRVYEMKKNDPEGFQKLIKVADTWFSTEASDEVKMILKINNVIL